MINKGRLQQYAKEYGLALDNTMLGQFERYARMLMEWNQRCNLTAITEPNDIIVKHFLDSLLVLNATVIPNGASIIDIGTGAGFPGIPLRIIRPDLELTLLDSLNKRVLFLRELTKELDQNNCCLHGRAEEFARSPKYRERYDIATARAVAALPALCEYCLPYVRTDGIFVAMKGFEVEEELSTAEKAITLMGGQIETVRKLELPLENRRAIVVIRKRSQTPANYPRTAVKITKSPL